LSIPKDKLLWLRYEDIASC